MSMTDKHYYFVDVDKIYKPSPTDYDVQKKGIHFLYFKKIYRVKLSLKTLLPIHIGSGEVVYDRRTRIGSACCIRKHIRDRNGKVFIPGSSIKGALTTYYHALYKNALELSELFGAPGYQSRIIISDFYPIADKYNNPIILVQSPLQYTPKKFKKRNSIKLYKPIPNTTGPIDENTVLESIPQYTELFGEIIVLNSNVDELAKVLIAMGYPPERNNYLMIGYAKGKGFGKIGVNRVLSIEEINFSPNDREMSQILPIHKEISIDNIKKRINEIIQDLQEKGVWNEVYQ